LLLKKGGRTVFAGDLGDESHKLVEYFESRGAPEINRGENPANWMLTVITAETDGTDYSEQFAASPDFEALKTKIQNEIDAREPDKEIKFDQEFAAPRSTRNLLVNERLRTVYWRSPAYNLMRMVISAVIAFILGSIFITNRRPSIVSEQEMTAIINTIFISFIIVGVLSINSVLPVMLTLRDTFYRQRAAGMLDHSSIALALGFAEKWFIVLSAFLFCVVYLGMMSLSNKIGANFAFWGFFCFNTGSSHSLWQCYWSLMTLTMHPVFYFCYSHLLLLWAIFYRLRSYDAHGADLGCCIHWTEQLLLGFNRPSSVSNWILRSSILDYAWTLRV
jgi:hypothetical protein